MSAYYQELRQKIGTQLIFCPSVVAVIRNELQQILFVQEEGATGWGLPAGAIEIGETPAEALIREVYEETGLSCVPSTLLGVFGGQEFRWVYPDGNQVEYLKFVFEGRIRKGTLHSVDGEIEHYQFFDERSFPPLQFPYPKEIFSAEGHEKTLFQRRPYVR